MNEDQVAMLKANLLQLELSVMDKKLQVEAMNGEVELLETFEPASFLKKELDYDYESLPEWLEYSKKVTIEFRKIAIEKTLKILEADEAGIAKEKAKIALMEQGVELNGGEDPESAD